MAGAWRGVARTRNRPGFSRPFVLVRPAWPLAIGLSTVFEVIWRWP